MYWALPAELEWRKTRGYLLASPTHGGSHEPLSALRSTAPARCSLLRAMRQSQRSCCCACCRTEGRCLQEDHDGLPAACRRCHARWHASGRSSCDASGCGALPAEGRPGCTRPHCAGTRHQESNDAGYPGREHSWATCRGTHSRHAAFRTPTQRSRSQCGGPRQDDVGSGFSCRPTCSEGIGAYTGLYPGRWLRRVRADRGRCTRGACCSRRSHGRRYPTRQGRGGPHHARYERGTGSLCSSGSAGCCSACCCARESRSHHVGCDPGGGAGRHAGRV